MTTRVSKKINWGSYKINKKIDKIGIVTSIVSTKVPFKGTSKEYIGEDAKAINDAIRRGIQSCASSLSKKILRKRQNKEKADRRRNLEK